MIRLTVKAALVAKEAWQDDGFGGRELRPMLKGAPAGYAPISGSENGGYHKRKGAGWEYWYPSDAHAEKAIEHHTKEAKRARRLAAGGRVMAAGDPTTRAGHLEHAGWNDEAAVEHDEKAAGAADFLDRDEGEELRKGRPTLHPLLKAVPANVVDQVVRPDLGSIQRDALGRPTAAKFHVGEYLFRFAKSAKGMPILTVTGPGCTMPYHMVVRSHADAMRQAPDIARTFADGRVPDEGVFRKEDDAAVRVRYPGRTPAEA